MSSDITKLNPIEQILTRLGDYPGLGILYTAVGAAILMAWDRIGAAEPAWLLLPFFAAVLILLRVVPAGFRIALPFSQEAAEIWREQRNAGRLYDSYQWQKLFWVGLGMAGYLLVAKNPNPLKMGLMLGCLLGGGAGLFIYQEIVRRKESAGKSVS